MLVSGEGFAQRHLSGVIVNDTGYQSQRYVKPDQSVWSTYAPSHLSFRKFTPDPADQGNCESCLGWATAYACLTTRWALYNNVTDKKVINANAFDAMYLYTRLANNCKAVGVLNVVDMVTTNGVALSKDLPKPVTPATNAPADKLQKSSYGSRIFDLDADSASKVQSTIETLTGFEPVLVVAKIDTTLFNITPEHKIWKPATNLPTNYHALCVIGFDNKTKLFEIMNSWGSNWGDHGYFFISYQDYARVVNYAFELSVDPRVTVSLTNMEGDLSVFASRNPANTKYSELKTDWNDRSNTYENDVHVAQPLAEGDIYQLRLSNLRKGRYVYVIGFKGSRAELLYPAESGAKTAIVTRPNNFTAYITPYNLNGGTTAIAGIVNFYVIYAQKPLDIKGLITQINNDGSPDPLTVIQKQLEDRLIPSGSINYDSGSVRVTGVRYNHDAILIPIQLFVLSP